MSNLIKNNLHNNKLVMEAKSKEVLHNRREILMKEAMDLLKIITLEMILLLRKTF